MLACILTVHSAFRLVDPAVLSRRSSLKLAPVLLAPLVPLAPRAVAETECQTEGRRVADTANYLNVQERERLERILAKLEADTGYTLRVLSRSRQGISSEEEVDWTRQPAKSILSCGFGIKPTPQTILVVADRGIQGALEAGSSFITYPYIGDGVMFSLPGVFWGRLQREYGRKAFVEKRGEAASIVTSCEIIITCLRNEEQFCTDVPPASASFF